MGCYAIVWVMDKTYKIHFTSDVYETVEVEAESKRTSRRKVSQRRN